MRRATHEASSRRARRRGRAGPMYSNPAVRRVVACLQFFQAPFASRPPARAAGASATAATSAALASWPDASSSKWRDSRAPSTSSAISGRQGVADAGTLIIRQRDGAMLAPRRRPGADERQPGAEGDRLLAPAGEEADGTGVEAHDSDSDAERKAATPMPGNERRRGRWAAVAEDTSR